MRPTVDELHETLFGFVPAKEGTAYERLAALVFARLRWRNVVFNSIQQAPGRLAKHQIDVVAQSPDGQLERVIIECKDWDKGVGKNTLDALVGVRNQLGADLAVAVTTEHFTRGARRVATDEGIPMISLCPIDPANPPNYYRKVSTTLVPVVPSFSDFGVVMGDNPERDGTVDIHLTAADHLQHLDGTEADLIFDVLRSQSGGLERGRFDRRADFPDGRLIPVVSGDPVRIDALTWVETVMSGGSNTVTIEAVGSPVLTVEEIDIAGKSIGSRIIVDKAMNASRIEADGRVVATENIEADTRVVFTSEPPSDNPSVS